LNRLIAENVVPVVGLRSADAFQGLFPIIGNDRSGLLVVADRVRGVSRVMLFSKAIIQAEWEANAPLREALAIKRERLRALRAKRAAKQCST
jgi:hypothetical protein